MAQVQIQDSSGIIILHKKAYPNCVHDKKHVYEQIIGKYQQKMAYHIHKSGSIKNMIRLSI